MKKNIIYLFISFIMSNYAMAQSSNKIETAVENLRLAMINPSKENLEPLLMEELSYGHSGGKIEDKASFMNNLLTGNSDFVEIALSNQQITLVKNIAIVRHTLIAQTNDKGVAADIKIHVLTTWVKTNNKWKLLARQAVKLTK